MAIRLYESNLRLSSRFMPLLSVLEVSLRNRINEIMMLHFRDTNWIVHQRNGFMSEPSLGNIRILKAQVEDAVELLNRKRLNVENQIITELSFSFWVRFFQADYFRLLRASPLRIFSNLPSSSRRDIIHQRLKQIVDFRNRIYHNEPVIFSTDGRNGRPIVDLRKSQEIHDFIYQLIYWLGGPELENWLNSNLDSVAAEVRLLNNYIEEIGVGRKWTTFD